MLSVLLFVKRVQMASRQVEETRRGANIFVQRIAFLIGRHHMLTLDVGKAGFQLFQRCADQLTQKLFRVALGVHLSQRFQPCGGFHVQVNRIAGLGQAAFGILFPVIGELSDFHRYLLIGPCWRA